MSYGKKNLCRDWKNHNTIQHTVKGTSQNRQPFQRRRISRMPRTTAKVLCQNNNFCQKIGKKGPIFPKKWGNRTTIPDNLIVCVSQSIGNIHETSQIFAHAEMITSNDQKRDHTGWATARGKEPVSRLEKPQHSRLMRNAQRYPILYLLQSIGGLQETQILAHGEIQHITNLCTR